MKYLISYLKENKDESGIAPFMKCSGGRPINGKTIDWRTTFIRDINPRHLYCPQSYSNRPIQNICQEEPVCPEECTCAPSKTYDDVFMILDCRDRKLTSVPNNIPDSIQQMRLEDNKITSLGNREFSPYRKLNNLDLSNNEIETIHENAFYGLRGLKGLMLYENKITSLAPRTFRGLSSLKILMLNSNHLRCVQRDLLEDLKQLEIV
jgi:slit protein 2